jgi:Flp pilus assembly pilin Flp
VKHLFLLASTLWRNESGSVFVEYILLLTLVGLGGIVGLAVVRDALMNELTQLAQAISNIL